MSTAGLLPRRWRDDPESAALHEAIRVPTGAAPDVKQSLTRFEAERVDDEGDLVLGAHREGVLEIRLTHVLGERLEPVISHAGRATWRRPRCRPSRG